jgi:choline dehydrogenase-like flavoprotein
MPPLFNIKGYTSDDPIDKAPVVMQYILMMLVSMIISVILVYAITDYFQLLEFQSFGVKVMEVVIFTLVFAPIMVIMRKSSSLVLMLVIFLPLFIFDIFLQAHFRDKGITSLWTYLPGTFIDDVKILPLRFLMTLSFDALLMGPVCLWITRMLALLLYRNREVQETATKEEYKNLFRDEWTSEKVEKPNRDFGYWVLRILGFSYLAYLGILIIGIFGESPWPPQIGELISMTYRNPALAINTFSKIGMMILFTFIGAYNVRVRYYCCWGLIVGHAVSTISSLGFYFYDPPGTDFRDFLLTSAIVDGVMIILFVIILIQSVKNTFHLNPEKGLTKFFSVPARLAVITYSVVGAVSFLLVIVALYFRLYTEGDTGLEAVFGYPDPSLGNTLTLYSTIAFVSIMLAVSERLRQYFFSVLILPFAIGAIVTVPILILTDIFSDLTIQTRAGTEVIADWYFVFIIIFNLLVFTVLTALRKMYYNIDYTVSSISPSGAKNIIALADAFYGGDAKKHSAILISIDQYVGGIRGRKRGLLNFPFWLVENILTFKFGLHPSFSSMSREEQRWFLKKYLLRSPAECRRSFVPILADFGTQIGIAVNAMIMFANYSDLNTRNSIGYVPLYARDRLQGDTPLYAAPFKNICGLPEDEKDLLNFKPESLKPEHPFVSNRISTSLSEHHIPDEADYVILGSGAGGSVMAYRLACEVDDPSKILVVERGNRYSPLQDFNDHEMEMMRKLYKEGGLQQTKKFTMSVLQGECVGGTTVINNAVCIEMTDQTRNKWQDEYDIDLSNLDAEYKKIADEIEIREIGLNGINKNVMSRFKKGVEGFNNESGSDGKLKPIYPLKANHRNIIGDENWNLGNKRLTKRTMLETYLPWSEARGVKVISNTTAMKFFYENGKANEIVLRSDTGEIRKVKVNKAIIVSGGVISSSHVLMRSGLTGNVGKNMSCNFAFPVTFRFDETINAFDGNQITLGALDENNRAIFETYFNPPAAFAMASVPFYFNRREDIMNNYSKSVNFGALVGSEPNGIIHSKADILNGQAFSWELGNEDRKNISYAFSTILKLGLHAGAEKGILPTKPGIELNLNPAEIEKFDNSLKDYPLRIEDLLIGTAHPQGGNIITGDKSKHKSKRVLNSSYCVEGVKNVYVADASVFPESMRLNPQWTIMAMSSMASKKILERHE